MSWTASLFEFVTTNSNVEADQIKALETQTISNFSKSASFDGINSTITAKVHVLSIVIGLVGIIVNVIVFATLCAFKEFRKNTTNVFICNQTLIDVVACLALTITMTIRRIGASDYVVGFTRRILCWFIDSSNLLGATLNASTFSLIVIALERYFKIVHPIKHRNNFRPWMVKLGVTAPWINGLFVTILPEWLTSDVVDGECRIGLEQPYAAKPYFTFMFVWHDVVPLLIFIFCYSKIFIAVRRQNRISAEVNQPSNATSGSSGGWARNAVKWISMGITTGASANEDPDHQHISRAEKKVILTMLTVTACCVITWFPLELFLIFFGYLPQTVAATGSSILAVLPYSNVLLNGVIYSFHLGVMTRSWQALRRLCGA